MDIPGRLSSCTCFYQSGNSQLLLFPRRKSLFPLCSSQCSKRPPRSSKSRTTLTGCLQVSLSEDQPASCTHRLTAEMLIWGTLTVSLNLLRAALCPDTTFLLCVCVCVGSEDNWVSCFRCHPPSLRQGLPLAENLPTTMAGCRQPQGLSPPPQCRDYSHTQLR